MRADKFLAEKFGSRTKAAEALEKGLVLVNGKPIKPKDEINDLEAVEFIDAEESFVSNGGYKLSRGLQAFAFDCKDKVFADLGASTGGFTDCLLQNGAKRVYAVDVGESLLHESLLSDSRVITMENTNARYLSADDFPEKIDGVVTDLSFISLRLIFPSVKNILGKEGDAFVLVKPQFECENKNIGKSGIVHPSAHAKIVEKVLSYAMENGLYPLGIVNAPLRKGKNIEYILRLQTQRTGAVNAKEIVDSVQEFIKNYRLEQKK